MFCLTRRHYRRWSPLLIAVMLLHWCLGMGTAYADVLCLEPNGKVVLELKGQPCPGEAVEQATGTECIDLAMSEDHANHESAPGKAPPQPQVMLLPVLLFLPLPPPPVFTGRESPPLFPTHPVALRATTVLLI